jgi:hypothetical protein
MTQQEAQRFVARYGGHVRTGSHNLAGRVLHWPYCLTCGLVALKNDASRVALRAPCVTIEDS